MTLQEITVADERYPYVEGLLVGSFPLDERRDLDEQRARLAGDGRMRCLLIVDDAGEPAGMLTYWHFGGFRYVEHFAVDPGKRCAGLGARAMRQFLAMSPAPVVLEVELPADGLSRRRVAFYQRLGFDLWPGAYEQPPYRPGGSPVPMCLMATAPLAPARDFAPVELSLRRHVYNVQQ